mmetsp:Transcript_105268/g.263600  ORF Transcript_105268/g.263600 Transcript_105268/m.263600 type:complete len:251 (+) Transcript_105268:57-809(+)
MKKHGGIPPGWRDGPKWNFDKGAPNDHYMWNADGTPFSRLTFVPAHYESSKEVVPPSVGSIAAAPPTLPDHLLRDLARALRARDSVAFSQAMEQLEGFDPRHEDYDDRMQLFVRGLKDILMNPSLMREGGAAFVLEAIDAKLREPESPGQGDPKQQYGTSDATVRQDVGRKIFTSDHPMADASCTILAPPSHLDEWESTSIFGRHPGIMFGAHCTATFAENGPEVTWGAGYMTPGMYDWFARYPNDALGT